MKILLIHADYFKYEVKQKAIQNPEKISQSKKKAFMDNVLVAFCTVEKGDEKDPKQIASNSTASIDEVAGLVKTKNIMAPMVAHFVFNFVQLTAAYVFG